MSGWLDAHVHVWEAADAIWVRDKVAALSGAFPLAALEPLALANGVSQVIVVQAAQTLDETRRCLAISEDSAFVAGVIGWVDLHSGELERDLELARSHPKFLGVRPLPAATFRPGWFDDPRTREGLRRLARAGVVVDILAVAGELSAAREAIQAASGLRAVLNHGGRPLVMCGDLGPWEREIRALGRVDGVYCKCSGLVERAGIEWNLDSVLPYLYVLFDAFGPERLMFASNWPVLNVAANYGGWCAALQTAFVRLGLSAHEERAITAESARHCYGIAPPN